ncbi:MAG: GTP-binding signal recognition particle G-domain [Bryobacterales bacterium]|jgi:flagellar biosynthesis protein FlhF|nr:GTP-binding signal recognition particle G-domain [Bryobacterales bacterium]
MKDANGMKIKSYFAKSVDEAIAKARVELGSEALLLNTRKIANTGPNSGNAAGYEVVMGVAGSVPARESVREPAREPAPMRAAASPARATVSAGESAPRTEMTAQMGRLRAQMDELQSLLVRSAKASWTAQRIVPEVVDVYTRLIAAEVDPVLSKDIADRLEAAMATDAFFEYAGPEPEGAQNRWKILKSDPARVEEFLRVELESRVLLRPRLGMDGAKSAVAAVVGPTGSGKTTSLAKLAVAASAQRPVRLVSLDSSRTGAQQLLNSLATPAIIFSSVDSIEDLPKLVADARRKECVLIDTRGFSTHEWPAAEKLAAALAACGDVDVHLVAPAYMKARDLQNCIERYRLFHPSKLLITRLDETETFGTVFSEAALEGLALSFLSHGPRIPDDIRAATVDDLLALVRERPRAHAQVAASAA